MCVEGGIYCMYKFVLRAMNEVCACVRDEEVRTVYGSNSSSTQSVWHLIKWTLCTL